MGFGFRKMALAKRYHSVRSDERRKLRERRLNRHVVDGPGSFEDDLRIEVGEEASDVSNAKAAKSEQSPKSDTGTAVGDVIPIPLPGRRPGEIRLELRIPPPRIEEQNRSMPQQR